MTVVALVAILAPAFLYFGGNWLLLGRLTRPTAAEFVSIASPYQPVAQAIVDYRAEHGLLPITLEQLGPAGATPPGAATPPGFRNGELRLFTRMPRTYVVYRFAPDRPGWFARGHGGIGALPLPVLASTRPTLAADALVAATLDEYDRRRAIDPRQAHAHWLDKVNYLVARGRRDAASAACAEEARASPDDWFPPLAIAFLSNDADLASARGRLLDWTRQHASFINWWHVARFERERGTPAAAIDALREAAKYPVGKAGPGGRITESGLACDAMAYAWERREPELLLALCDRYQAMAYVNGEHLAYRAAAELMLARFDAALTHVDAAIADQKRQANWVARLPELRRAIVAGDVRYAGKLDALPNQWKLFWTVEER